VAMTKLGLTAKEAHERFWLLDDKGLLGKDREVAQDYQQPWIRPELPDKSDLLSVVKAVHPTILFGLTGQGGLFKEDIIREMAAGVKRPILFPLSNPTSKAELTAENAYAWTEGRCIFGSGSPFEPVNLKGKTYYPSQTNNMYTFPGLGLGGLASRATIMTDGMLHAASLALSQAVKLKDLKDGKLFPRVREIRSVSQEIALAVCKEALSEGVARMTIPGQGLDQHLKNLVKQKVWEPKYGSIVSVPEIPNFQRA